MYINHCSYTPMPQRALQQQPRDRYITYFNDLYRISDKTLSEETFLQGDQYSYTNIIDEMLVSGLPFEQCESISDVVFSYWTPEWDPEHSAFATYFLWKSEIDAEIFDVCDVGSIATTTALHVLFNTDAEDDKRSKIVVGMEQTSVPRNLADYNIMPVCSSGSALFVSNANSSNAAFKIEDSVYINENAIYSGQYAVSNAITELMHKHGLSAGDCMLVIKRIYRSFKELDYLSDKKEIDSRLLENARFVAGDYSVNDLARQIISSAENPPNNRMWIYVDEDAESLNTTLTLMRPL